VTLRLPPPPGAYNPAYEAQRNRLIELYSNSLYEKGQDVGVYQPAKLIVSDASFITTDSHTPAEGSMSWNTIDGTLDLGMEYGVIQQIGQETYARVENMTGSTIANGSVVGFSGVGANNVLSVTKYLANGATPTLYILGVMTHELPDSGQVGYCTTFGHVRGINTSGFSVGDILYASPTTAGAFTNVKPTAPDNVVPVAAVLKVGTSDGEIFVRPAIEQQYYFGQFTKNATITPAAANTAYALAWDTTVITEGITLAGSPTTRLTVAHSGLYNFAARIQFSAGNSNAKSAWMWLKKNGTTNIGSSTAVGSLKDSGGYSVLAINDFVSLGANDYVELFWAVDDTGLQPTNVTATAFAPSAPTAHVAVTQVQQ
jgi:hypothetical protein